MADNPLKRYLDAGVAFTAMTQAKAEDIVKDLVKAGEVQTEQAQAAVADLLDRSRDNTERLLETVRAEVKQQVETLGLVGQAEIARLEKRIEALTGRTPTTEASTEAVRTAAAQKGAATKAKKAAKRSAAAKRGAATKKKAAAKRSTASKKAATKKAATKKASAKKKAGAKKAAAKKAAAKKRS